ncbi:MAG: hypothetical protein J6U84_01355 [Bacteroidales bacterium]|jgi:hypothetical protein|nr:hypothetical protein [Bacteroidales bacterium]
MSQLITHNGELVRINPEQRNRIEVSKDGGRIWRLRYQASVCGDFIELNDAGTEIIATTTKGIYASKNGGMVWLKRK